jgi:hypothetical protein
LWNDPIFYLLCSDEHAKTVLGVERIICKDARPCRPVMAIRANTQEVVESTLYFVAGKYL